MVEAGLLLCQATPQGRAAATGREVGPARTHAHTISRTQTHTHTCKYSDFSAVVGEEIIFCVFVSVIFSNVADQTKVKSI